MCMSSLFTVYVMCKGNAEGDGKSIYWQANAILAAHSRKPCKNNQT